MRKQGWPYNNNDDSKRRLQLAKENEEKKEQLRSSSTYCGSCYYLSEKNVTCDERMQYMISEYHMSVEDAFHYVIDSGGMDCIIISSNA